MSSAPSVPADSTDEDRTTALGGPGDDVVARLLLDAQTIYANHSADEDGYCSGCLRQWARLARHPCSQNHWAVSVISRLSSDR
jgi:hypothetical protein